MEFKVNLPLKLTVSFYKWQGNDNHIKKIIKNIENLKLFSLCFEFDGYLFPAIKNILPQFSIKAFKKILLVNFIDYVDDSKILSNFNEVEVEIPFYSREKEIEDFLKSVKDKEIIISFFLTRENVEIFRKILNFSLKHNKKVKIPNPNLVRYKDSISSLYLRKVDLEKLEDIKYLVKNVNIEVHDYFLAKFFCLKDAEKFSGCQAGKLMGHIENGVLYPCASIPIGIGSLIDDDFENLWNKAYNIVDEVFKVCCKGCKNREFCKLGCIGNAIFLGNNKDPLCED